MIGSLGSDWFLGLEQLYTVEMTWFSARNVSLSVVPATPEEIWPHVTDPSSLADMTPFVETIEAVGEHWLWTLKGIDGLGVTIDPIFTERMEFTEHRQIIFAHDPPAGSKERAGVEGVYDLAPAGTTGTELRIDIELKVDLPLPRLSRLAVEPIMHTTMSATGHRFASNLYAKLGLDPSDISIQELPTPKG